MDELLAAYNDITASGLGPSQPQCDAAKAEQRSLAEPCAKFRCHADLAGLTSSASATRSLRGRLKLHDLVLVARISSLIFLDD
ncbi:hypothetical protein ABIB75_005231 [Bradyrhizobium sp. GM2.2]|jgi:hypothetical protein|nr:MULTISPECIES: hypothetical protein [unclassified Bradyrhizobium]MCK1289249.1 hypothetical protein [Bradyrhizobium sp. 30]MCK1349728.1 hypothetical protein [Bradyrhizobium sp. CW7]MCK1577074.1 hypothetical protein [Bradyrhizobium sp. 174]MCK1266572.1 hypothetical protein [Bradyrhizobium sp. 84]MCK1306544.1 hypothetical protein [Bradyrhizobium sp. 45]